jgi:hypothetical protein
MAGPSGECRVKKSQIEPEDMQLGAVGYRMWRRLTISAHQRRFQSPFNFLSQVWSFASYIFFTSSSSSVTAHHLLHSPIMTLMFIFSLGLSWLLSVYAQSSHVSPTPTPSRPLNVSLSLTTSSYTGTTVFPYGAITVTAANVITTVFNVTVTPTSTASNNSATATHTSSPYVLDTRLDPAFGVLGALLVLSGLPSAFWGHKNRWSVSLFLLTFTSHFSSAVLTGPPSSLSVSTPCP